MYVQHVQTRAKKKSACKIGKVIFIKLILHKWHSPLLFMGWQHYSYMFISGGKLMFLLNHDSHSFQLADDMNELQ